MQEKTHKPVALKLDVMEIERRGRAGCCTSSTSPRCTCPVSPTICGTGLNHLG